MIQATFIGTEAFLTRLNNLVGNISPEVHKGMLRSLIKLQRRVKQEKLSGQVLHVRTGTLRRSINYAITSEGDNVITGVVGTNVSYAAAHEYGFKGTVGVRSYVRENRGAGHWSSGSNKGSKWVRGKKTGTSTIVKAHNRDVNIPERSFLRSALAEMLPDFRAEMQDAVRRAAGIK